MDFITKNLFGIIDCFPVGNDYYDFFLVDEKISIRCECLKYNFFTNNCGDWVINVLNRCCLQGNIPEHIY
jgi:hypothetical protein